MMEQYPINSATVDFELSHILLDKFSNTWSNRSRIRKDDIPIVHSYEIEKPDFLENLIPIKQCTAYINLPDNIKNKLLSYGWLAYNAKTIAIESKIISPVCYHIIDGHVSGLDNNKAKKIIAQTLIDESYHILLCHYAMSMTERYRLIDRHLFPEFDLVNKIKELEQKFTENWQKILIKLAVAIVSEIFISDYLKVLSDSHEIVSLNRATVYAHRMDEVAHGYIFKELTKLFFRKLNKKEQRFLAAILHYPVQYFASKELQVWKKILMHICPEVADDIMQEACLQQWFDLSSFDYQHLIRLADEIGIKNFAAQFANDLEFPVPSLL